MRRYSPEYGTTRAGLIASILVGVVVLAVCSICASIPIYLAEQNCPPERRMVTITLEGKAITCLPEGTEVLPPIEVPE